MTNKQSYTILNYYILIIKITFNNSKLVTKLVVPWLKRHDNSKGLVRYGLRCVKEPQHSHADVVLHDYLQIF